jgi:hypothetical protein
MPKPSNIDALIAIADLFFSAAHGLDGFSSATPFFANARRAVFRF